MQLYIMTFAYLFYLFLKSGINGHFKYCFLVVTIFTSRLVLKIGFGWILIFYEFPWLKPKVQLRFKFW